MTETPASSAFRLAYVPGERRRSAFADLDVRENLTAGAVDRYWNGVVIRKDRERRDAREAMARFGVEAASDAQPLATLSGGNQQKVVLGRRLHHRPRLLLLDEPTQGVDVGARAHLYLLIREAADAGTGVVLSTLDFDEIAGLCDRALVLANGRIVGELRRPLLDADRLTELAYRGAA